MDLNARRRHIAAVLRDEFGIVVTVRRVVDIQYFGDRKDFLRVDLPYGLDQEYLDFTKGIKTSDAVKQTARACGVVL
jgi:hypothetical protein